MQNQNEISRINRFLCMVSPIVIGQVKMILQSAGLQVEEKGSGSDLVFIIKSGEKEIHFSPYNLLLEIVSVDRDQLPLRFDENLQDFGFFLDNRLFFDRRFDYGWRINIRRRLFDGFLSAAAGYDHHESHYQQKHKQSLGEHSQDLPRKITIKETKKH